MGSCEDCRHPIHGGECLWCGCKPKAEDPAITAAKDVEERIKAEKEKIHDRS